MYSDGTTESGDDRVGDEYDINIVSIKKIKKDLEDLVKSMNTNVSVTLKWDLREHLPSIIRSMTSLYRDTFHRDFSRVNVSALVDDLIYVYNQTFRIDMSGAGNYTLHAGYGNFITDALGYLIRPFFEIGIKLLTQVVLVVESILHNILDEMEKAVEIVLGFVEVIAEMIGSVIRKLESKYLLFEYALGFVILLYLCHDIYISIVVTISVLIMFGCRRSVDNVSIFE